MRHPFGFNRALRAAGLLLVGALAVHWLRYWLAYGSQAAAELHSQGHSYLVDLLPTLVAVGVAFVLSAAVLRLSAGRDRSLNDAPAGRGAVVYGLALFVVFAAQELSEGVLAPGHAAGLAGVFAEGGWLALPLSTLFGGALALVERLVERAELSIAALFEADADDAREPTETRAWSRTVPTNASLATRLLAFGFSRRPPPATAVI